MVKGCHSQRATSGILMKTQSPGLKLNPGGRLMIRCVTLEGRITPALTRDLPRPRKLVNILYVISMTKIQAGPINHFQNSGACIRSRAKYKK